jgi:hypothetical protein
VAEFDNSCRGAAMKANGSTMFRVHVLVNKDKRWTSKPTQTLASLNSPFLPQFFQLIKTGSAGKRSK